MMTAHLTDDRLVDLYFTETPSVREQQHLGACRYCETRRSELAHLLDETAQASAEDMESAFPAERLARQHMQILERAEAVAGPARVIAFPAVPAPIGRLSSRTNSTSRWIAAAAVAGLVVGVVAGRAGRDARPVIGRTPGIQLSQTGEPSVRTVSTTLSDDEFLVEMESAIEGQGSGALRALDELTPRAWER